MKTDKAVNTKHTPGPWKWERIEGKRVVLMPFDDYRIVGSNGQPTGILARGFGVDAVVEGVDSANARLIAAAPELLAALKHILKTLPLDHGTDVKYLMAYEAIAKAEGK